MPKELAWHSDKNRLILTTAGATPAAARKANGFTGRNRIICIMEATVAATAARPQFKLLFGYPPPEFFRQYSQDIGDYRTISWLDSNSRPVGRGFKLDAKFIARVGQRDFAAYAFDFDSPFATGVDVDDLQGNEWPETEPVDEPSPPTKKKKLAFGGKGAGDDEEEASDEETEEPTDEGDDAEYSDDEDASEDDSGDADSEDADYSDEDSDSEEADTSDESNDEEYSDDEEESDDEPADDEAEADDEADVSDDEEEAEPPRKSSKSSKSAKSGGKRSKLGISAEARLRAAAGKV